jgi:hypothetical protein
VKWTSHSPESVLQRAHISEASYVTLSHRADLSAVGIPRIYHTASHYQIGP